ncbi:4-hydroxybenzoyl-CoA thioesterase [Andreprevotia lacus DSM 23236]|jgi:acyl-CoA thioesterase FadM|uniref:4-hydroxybenzoyl-CoA thioesterase n=1 Tax=Andreprevotia lacus DSM 23236 TaxID=1121001 RepID=A0A1W1XXD8_9NEIS|nr:thioesterase family protein [Andreprevotia lacus]SMC28178.1 4-hydroxybenzoyl-CoA thioesterase [Andreprevotia lacus DSM 23236]
MSRLKLDLPAHCDHATCIAVRITDLNYGGHLANQALLALMQEARVGFLAALGFSELGSDTLPGIILADVAVVYRSEAFAGEQLTFELAADEMGRSSFDLYYRIRAAEREVAQAKTSIVFFDYAKRKSVAIPAAFIEALQGLREAKS